MMIAICTNWRGDWWQARPALERVCRNPQVDMEIDDIYALLLAQRAALVKLDGGWAVVRLLPDRLHVVAVSGTALPTGWAAMFTNWLKDMARGAGVPRATLGGRKGWRRALKHLGWVPTDEGMEVSAWAV